ncbi:P-loop containing nucleoside triphosphate hydrolase protein, partial [Podospora aff. communis PSN243]
MLLLSRPMAPSNVVLLLIGLHGTGKSTFAKAATGQDVKVNPTGGVDAYTKECNKYTVDFKQRRFIIIDTPGMADQNTIEENLDVLQQVADQLQNLDQERVNGVIYFHSIEGARLSGVDRDNIRILKKICGDEFFPRVAFVTTRWDRIRRSEWDPILVPRNRDLETERMKLLPNGPSIFRFLNDGESHKAVLDYFAGLEDGTAANRGDKKARRSGTG